MSVNLMLAIAEEHKQRTGHDPFNGRQDRLITIGCNVCLYIDAEWRKLQQAEREYYEQLEREAQVSE